MARSVGENIEKNPTAISRPEGGWFARIWNERSKSEKLLISLDRSEAFTVWVRSIEKCKDLQFLDEVFSSSVESRGNDDCISEAEFISLPPSKALVFGLKFQKNRMKKSQLCRSKHLMKAKLMRIKHRFDSAEII